MADADPPVIQHPTWLKDIRLFFTDTDVAHMKSKGIDLSAYDVVVANAAAIYAQTHSGAMPLGQARWSANKVQSFLNWITDNYPLGTAEPAAPAHLLFADFAAAGRVRKEVTALSAQEVAKLRTAFQGVIDRDPTADDSYFAIAGVHWFPAIDKNPKFHCLHHEDRFLAWHRIHLKRFEDALRSVPGCDDVTLPYWDITTPLPQLFTEPPFDSFHSKTPIGHDYDPLVTVRNSAADILSNMKAYKIPQAITDALGLSQWDLFNTSFWAVHDNGHDSCGPTMGNQDIAAFDPVFWFFHCNLDRIWLQWQRAVGATTLAGFKSTINPNASSSDWLDVPALGILPPFSEHAADAVALTDIDYAPPQQGFEAMTFQNPAGHALASHSFRISAARPLSVRVKDIDRSKIPGTFVVHLLADGKEVARQAFFQPTNPKICPSCREQANVAVDFRVEPKDILDKALNVEISVPSQKDIGSKFPLSQVGSPTINVRHLVESE